MKWLLRQLLRVLFGFRAYNEEVLNTPGPVLLIPNHVSWLDWLFLYVCTGADWKCVVSSVSAQTSWVHRKIMINRRTFPIDTNSPYAVKRMAEYLEGKGQLALFAEGRARLVGKELKVKVTAPPVDSAANEAVLEFLAGILGCPRNQLELLRGATSRHKQILVRGITAAQVEEKLR